MAARRHQSDHGTPGKADERDAIPVHEWLSPEMLGRLEGIASTAEQINAGLRTIADALHAARSETVHQKHYVLPGGRLARPGQHGLLRPRTLMHDDERCKRPLSGRFDERHSRRGQSVRAFGMFG